MIKGNESLGKGRIIIKYVRELEFIEANEVYKRVGVGGEVMKR